jgi:PAS domain S-box-containing protein
LAQSHLLAEIIRNSSQPFCIGLPDGRLTMLNHAFAELVGYSEEALLNMRWDRDLTPEAWREIEREALAELHSHGRPVRYEKEYLRQDGSRVPIELLVHLVTDSDKQRRYYQAFITDITARKQATNALQASKDLLQSIVDNSATLIYVFDRNMRMLVANKALGELIGLPLSEMIGKRRAEFLPKKMADRHEENDRRVMETGRSQQFEEAGIFKGQAVTFLTTKFPLTDERGGIWAVGGISTEITERKQAEESLRESEERFRLAFENSNIGMCLVGTDGGLLRVNRQLCEMFGYGKAELEGMSVNSITHPDYLNVSPSFIQKATRNEIDHFEFEKAYIHKQGHVVWGHISSSLVRSGEGEPMYFISHVVDITERVRSEQEREKLQEQLNQAQKMEAVGRLSGGVAHDFNNMLGVIMGFTDLAAIKLPSDHAVQIYLEEVKTAAQRSANITRQLLAFARKQIVAPQVIDLNEIIESMLKMLRRLIGEDIDLLWKPAKSLWLVKIDPAQVDQMLANLIVNARDAISGVGKITIETGNVEFDEPFCKDHNGATPGPHAMLCVSDNGCGMDKETMAKIFEPFFTTKETGKGTGLGLSTIYGIVKQNNGYIDVHSEKGQGATFKIYLPRQEQPESGEVPAPIPMEVPCGTETVLLVEDEESLLKFARMLLEELSYTVLTARRPQEAIRLAEAYGRKIDLLITDVVMPEMSGRDLWERLEEIRPGLKCLYMSGYTADVIAPHGVLAEGVHFLEKPFVRQALATKVREALS